MIITSEYLIKETSYLRSLYGELRKETRALETYTVLTVGVIWSWHANNNDSIQVDYLIWLPAIIVHLFGIRAIGVYAQMITIRNYLKKVETTIDNMPEELGWERFLNQEPLRSIWPITAFLFWGILGVLSILVPSLLKN